MSTIRVKHGQTFALSGTLAAGQTLIGLTGDPGAQIEVSGTATNLGTISLYGARLPHKQGATLNDTGVLTNAGLIGVGGATHATNGALLLIDGTLTNNATLYGQAGVYGAGGQIDVVGAGRLRNNGTITLGAGTREGSSGATLVDAGVLVNNARGIINAMGAIGQQGSYPYNGGSGSAATIVGTFTNNGTVNLYNAYRSQESNAAATIAVTGTMQNAGYVLIGKTEYPSYAYGGAELSVGGSLSNTGSIDVTGQYVGFGGASVRSTLAVSGTLTNEGTITLQPGSVGGHYSGSGKGALLLDTGMVTNAGLLMIEGYAGGGQVGNPYLLSGADLVIDGMLTNTGTILQQQDSKTVLNGTFDNMGALTAFGGHGYTYIGFYPGYGGYLSINGRLINKGTLSLGGGGSEKPSSNVTPTIGHGASAVVSSGIIDNYDLFVVGGGSGGYPTRFGSSFGTGATLDLRVDDPFIGLFNFGTVEIEQGATSTYGLYGTGGLLIVAGSAENDNVITIAGGLGNSAGTLQVAATGFFNSYGTVDGSGVLLNLGGFGMLGNDGIVSGVTFVNDGTMTALGLGDRISSMITADTGLKGVINLYNDATLQLGGRVDSSQTVVFEGKGGLLQLQHVFTFAGTLSGLHNTDTIDFQKQDVISAVATGDTLAIGLSSGTTLDLALAAPLTGKSLTLQSDGHGGTDLVFSAAPST